MATLASVLVFAPSLVAVDAAVWVNGYNRKDGTYVQGHYRSNPDGNPYNNWSYPGNTNPYTGEVAPGNPDTYLKNYYNGSGSSYGSSGGSYTGSTGAVGTSVVGGYYVGSTLLCNYGYYKRNGSCLEAPAHATAYGGTSFYCTIGYYQDGDRCQKLPDHAYAVGGSWQCYSGYIKQGNHCVAPENGRLLGGMLVCNAGHVARNSQCVSHTQDCRLHFGEHVLGTPGTGNNSSCACESGYTWNSTQTACVQNPFAASAVHAAPGGSIEELQRQIQALLATIAALQSQLAALQAAE